MRDRNGKPTDDEVHSAGADLYPLRVQLAPAHRETAQDLRQPGLPVAVLEPTPTAEAEGVVKELPRFVFKVTCINSTAALITPMVEAEREITRRTFLGLVHRAELKMTELALGYADHPRRGLTMAGDWHVTYYRSNYDGRPCIFFRHSMIEYVFVEARP